MTTRSIKHSVTIVSLAGAILTAVMISLLVQAGPTHAAPSEPVSSGRVFGQIITPTKQAEPAALIAPGSLLTYTIIFTAGNEAGQVVMTDTAPLSTTYKPGTITAAGTSGVVITPTFLAPHLVWTATNVITGSQVTATFVVTVDQNLGQGAAIVNTAWFSDGLRVYSATQSVTVDQLTVYLPIVIKPAPVELTIIASNTGGITSLKIGTHICITPIPDGSTPCGVSFPPGIYFVEAMTNRCGKLTATLPFYSGNTNLDIKCN